MSLKEFATDMLGEEATEALGIPTDDERDLTQEAEQPQEPKAEKQNAATNRRRLKKITQDDMVNDPDLALERFDFHFGDLFASEKEAVAWVKSAFKFSQAKREETTASKVQSIKANLTPAERQRLLEELQAG